MAIRSGHMKCSGCGHLFRLANQLRMAQQPGVAFAQTCPHCGRIHRVARKPQAGPSATSAAADPGEPGPGREGARSESPHGLRPKRRGVNRVELARTLLPVAAAVLLAGALLISGISSLGRAIWSGLTAPPAAPVAAETQPAEPAASSGRSAAPPAGRSSAAPAERPGVREKAASDALWDLVGIRAYFSSEDWQYSLRGRSGSGPVHRMVHRELEWLTVLVEADDRDVDMILVMASIDPRYDSPRQIAIRLMAIAAVAGELTGIGAEALLQDLDHRLLDYVVTTGRGEMQQLARAPVRILFSYAPRGEHEIIASMMIERAEGR